MTKRGRLIAFSCVGTALLAFLAFRVGPRRGPEAEATPEAPRLRCELEAGQTRAFRMVVTPSDAEGDRPALTAELHLRTLTGPSGPTRAAQVAGMIVPTQAVEGADQLREPFLMTVNDKCRFERFAFNEATSGTQASMIEGTVRLFEVVGGDTRSPSWEVLQRDVNGEFFASYVRGEFSDTTLDFARTSSDYHEAEARGTSIRQLRFDSEGRFDAAFGWVTRVTGTTLHRVQLGGGPTEVAVRFELERSDAPAPLGLPGSMDVALFRWSSDHAPDAVAPPEMIGGMTRAAVVALDSDALGARALELWNASDNPAHEDVYQLMLAWVREQPGGAEGLLDAIRAGELDPRLESMAFLVLGMADTEESRQALAGALTDGELSAMNRQRAALALGTNATPTLSSLAALRAAAQQTGDGPDDIVTRGTMMRAAGGLGRDSAPEEVREQARAYIRGLATSDDVDIRVAGLDAAGNAGTEALLDVVRAGFDDARPVVRSSAYNALRDMPRDLIQPVIADALQHEAHGDVRRALVSAAYTNATATARPYVDPLLAQAAVETLATTPDEGARVAAIGLAGLAAQRSPEVRAALARWLEQETDPSVIQALGRHLSVAEARAALARGQGTRTP